MPDSPPPDRPPLHGPFAGVVGYELSDWTEDRAVVTLQIDDRHMNRSGILHGGVMATLIDSACGFAGCYRAPPQAKRRAMTLSLHSQFLGAVLPGATLTAEATKTGGGKQIFFSSCEVRDQDGNLVGRGDGTFRYRSER